MEQMAQSKNIAYDWTGMSYQEKRLTESPRIQDNATFVLALSVVLVFLVLAAQYESWTSPAAVISVVLLCRKATYV